MEKEPKLEKSRSKTSSEIVEEETVVEISKEEIVDVKEEEAKPLERIDPFRKFDPSSPAKPTPKHLQRHMRNDSMRFPSGDFSNITITPRKSVSENAETKVDTFTKEAISQKEIAASKVEEKLEDGDRSPDLVIEDEKDIAEATLKDKINNFESRMVKEVVETPKTTVKLTKEALKKHTLEQDQGIEYTQEFVREQSKQITSMETHVTHKITVESEKHIGTIKSVKETIQQFDSKLKQDDKKPFSKTMRTDSTLVQVSSEEDSEFLKKSTDSETETESQTTVKADKLEQKCKIKVEKDMSKKLEDKDMPKRPDKDDKKPDESNQKEDQVVAIKEMKLEKQMTEELRIKVSEEDITETLEEKDVSVSEKVKQKVCSMFVYIPKCS